MLVARYLTRPTPSHKRYLQGRKQFPLKFPIGPLTQADALFEQVLHNHPINPPVPPKQCQSWYSQETLHLIDTCCSLRRNPHHDRSEARRLTRAINTSINNTNFHSGTIDRNFFTGFIGDKKVLMHSLCANVMD